MLELHELRRRFGEIEALAGVSFAVPPGSMVGFVGRNGAGKTTSMRIALDLIQPDSGEVLWDGRPIDQSQRRALFGYLPEERGLYPKMRVIDQLVYFGRLHGMLRGDALSSARRWLEQLGIGDRQAAMLDELSHGNQQRVQLAAALLHEPDVLVLDEPFSGLDPVAVDAMAEALAAQVARGAGVVFSSHQLELVERLCDTVVIIDAGRVITSGPIEQVRAQRAARRLELELETAADLPGGLPAWLSAVPGVAAVETRDGCWQVELQPDADDQAILDAARSAGRVHRFGPVVPTLAELFREVVR